MFSEPNINTSPLLEKGAKGKKKDFEQNHWVYVYNIASTCNTPYKIQNRTT